MKTKCPEPLQKENAHLTLDSYQDSYEEGDTVKYKCHVGHFGDFSRGRGISSCQSNGKWTKPNFSCLPVQCPSLDNFPLKYGNIISTEPTFGNIATFECDPGYKKWTESGIMERMCMENGKWNGDEFKCIPINCPELSDIENGNLHGNLRVFNEQVTYSCQPNYNLVGDTVRVCLQNGTWSNSEPKCVIQSPDIECPNPLSEDFILKYNHLEKTNVEIGIKPKHQVNFVCKNNAKLGIRSTCAADGNWDPPPPINSFCVSENTNTAIENTKVEKTKTIKNFKKNNKNYSWTVVSILLIVIALLAVAAVFKFS